MNDYDVPIMINKPGEGYDQLDVAARQVFIYAYQCLENGWLHPNSIG